MRSVGSAGISTLSNSKLVATYYCGTLSIPFLSDPTLFCKDNLPYATLSWTTDPNATSYNLYRTNPDNSSSTYSTRTPSFTDRGDFALRFDGVNDYGVVEKNDDSLNKFDAGLTVEAWGKQTSYTGGADSWLLDKDWNGYRIWGADRLMFEVRTPTQWWEDVGWSNSIRPVLNQWYHVVGVLDNINQKMYLYIDGNLARTTDLTEKYNFNYSDTPLTFGKHSGADSFWPGVIDEVRIYGRPLSATEVSEHYQGIYKNEAELRGAWHFDEGEGGTIYDSSGKGNNGRIGGPVWISGEVNNALEFEGLNDRVSIPYFGESRTELTVEFWARLAEIADDWDSVIRRSTENNYGWRFYQ